MGVFNFGNSDAKSGCHTAAIMGGTIQMAGRRIMPAVCIRIAFFALLASLTKMNRAAPSIRLFIWIN